MTPDFTIENHGSICLVVALNGDAETWLRDTAPVDAQFLGRRRMACEPRYVQNVIDVAELAGFTVLT